MSCGGTQEMGSNNEDIDDFSIFHAIENGDFYEKQQEDIVAGEDKCEELYLQLAQKDDDLILAAEFGKALLEKNEELEKKNEQLTEEYNQKLEELEQEKHELRLRLEMVESEYEATVRELQNDVTVLRHQIQEHEEQTRQGEKTNSHFVHELRLQNERLTEELKKATDTEDDLQNHVIELRQQVQSRKTSIHEHVHQLEILHDEINMLTERRTELEKRITSVTEERDTLACNLDEANDRILMLERQKREQDQQLRNQEREVTELQDQNAQLQDKADILSMQASSATFDQSSNSLFSELEMCHVPHSMSMDSLNRDVSPDSMEGQAFMSSLARPTTYPIHRPHFHVYPLYGDEDDIECDDDPNLGVSFSDDSPNHLPMNNTLTTLDGDDIPNQSLMNNTFKTFEGDEIELKQELFEAYCQLHGLLGQLKRADDKIVPDSIQTQDIKSGSLSSLLDEFRVLLGDFMKAHSEQNSVTTDGEDLELLENQVENLKHELNRRQTLLDKAQSELNIKDLQLKKQFDDLTDMTKKVSLQHQQMSNLQKERDQLMDQKAGVTRDDIVEQARSDRDSAISKKNSMEMELTRAQLDLMSLDSQLMETIQQKIDLSQQLEQWQIDMQELIESQMSRRIEQEERKERKKKKTSSPRKKFSLFWS